MLGSPNFVRFVYDGDGTIGDPGPDGSDVIEQVFTDFFDRRHQASEPTEFDGRSDYFQFINVGIPAGGLFSGAEGIKTVEQQAKYGGTAGAPYDPCYHQACDTISNLSRRSLDQLGKAAAHAVFHFAMTRDNPRPASAQAKAALVSAARSADYRGPFLVR
jgi:Zn-dependent M28 family amino/carboxypeptidase